MALPSEASRENMMTWWATMTAAIMILELAAQQQRQGERPELAPVVAAHADLPDDVAQMIRPRLMFCQDARCGLFGSLMRFG